MNNAAAQKSFSSYVSARQWAYQVRDALPGSVTTIKQEAGAYVARLYPSVAAMAAAQ